MLGDTPQVLVGPGTPGQLQCSLFQAEINGQCAFSPIALVAAPARLLGVHADSMGTNQPLIGGVIWAAVLFGGWFLLKGGK